MTRLKMVIGASLGLLAPARALAQDSIGVPSCPGARDRVVQLWCQGGALFIQHDQASYAKAIVPYSRALQMEKQRRTLTRTAWLILIDNLGMAYGITGDLHKATETFEYGLTKEPKYPMFYYLLADAYAEMNDESRAITNLNRAFTLRGNVISGEALPDPSTDDSFQRFMHDQRFLAALKALPTDRQ